MYRILWEVAGYRIGKSQDPRVHIDVPGEALRLASDVEIKTHIVGGGDTASGNHSETALETKQDT